MRIATLALVCLAALSACAPQSQGVTLIQSVSPGDTTPSEAEAVSLFKSVCVDTRARHAAMRAQLATLPVTYDTSSEIWYHDDFDLSFKAIRAGRDEVCSFVSAVDRPQTVDRVAQTARDAGMVVRTFSTRGQGEPDYITVQTLAAGR